MSWFLLLLAGLLEIVWTVALKYSDGFSRPLPSLITLTAMLASVVLLGLAMKQLPVATAYGVWVGIGIVGAAIAGIFLFAESANLLRMLSMALIVAGVIGLKLT